MLRDKDLFISGTDETTINPEELAAEEDNQTIEDATNKDVVEEDTTATTEEVTKEDNAITEDTTVSEDQKGDAEADKVIETDEAKSVEEIINEFDKLSISQDKQDTTAEEIQKTSEEIKDATDKGEDTTLLIEKLQQQIVELTNENRKSKVTTDFLSEQIDSMQKENLQLKYGRVDEDGIMSVINSDDTLKAIISQTIKSQNGSEDKEALIRLHQSKLEDLTGLKFDEFIASKNKQVESQMSGGEDDVSMEFSGKDAAGDSLFM